MAHHLGQQRLKYPATVMSEPAANIGRWLWLLGGWLGNVLVFVFSLHLSPVLYLVTIVVVIVCVIAAVIPLFPSYRTDTSSIRNQEEYAYYYWLFMPFS